MRRLAIVFGVAVGFYLPGLAPVSFCRKVGSNLSSMISIIIQGEEEEGCKSQIELFVNRLTSSESVIPFEYSAFDFCTASKDKKSPSENLGQVLFGEVCLIFRQKILKYFSESVQVLTISCSEKKNNAKYSARKTTKLTTIRLNSSSTE